MMHFDIMLESATDGMVSSTTPIAHRVRKTVLHPAPSRGYQNVFGSIPEIKVREGFSVVRMDYHSPKDLFYSFNSIRCPVMFAYVLKGERYFRITGDPREVVTREGYWYAGYLGESSGTGRISGTPAIRSVKFRFDPLVLYELLEGKVFGLPHRLAFLLKRLEGDIITIGGRMNAAMTAATLRVLKSPRDTALQRLEFEGSVLDLFILHLQELYGAGAYGSPTPHCSDKTRLARAARDMLMASLAAPPGLNRMASRLGTSALALKSSFINVFGASPHKYARARRLEAAKHLLEGGHMNVNEVSSELGYANPSRFIDAFYRTYGVRPGEFMRRVRRSYLMSSPAQPSSDRNPDNEYGYEAVL